MSNLTPTAAFSNHIQAGSMTLPILNNYVPDSVTFPLHAESVASTREMSFSIEMAHFTFDYKIKVKSLTQKCTHTYIFIHTSVMSTKAGI